MFTLQLDEDKQQFLNRWLPEQLAPHVKVVVSMIEGTPTHRMLRAYKTNPRELICGPLDLSSREVRNLYGKVLQVKLVKSPEIEIYGVSQSNAPFTLQVKPA